MTFNNLDLKYDGVCLYATIIVKPRLVGIFILALFNIVLLAAIIFFSFERVFPGAVVFSIAEIFVIRYTLWNLYGEERLVINTKSLTFQQHYGFFTIPYKTILFNKRFAIFPYEEIVEGDQIYFRYQFQSFNNIDLPEIIYQSVLSINKTDFDRFTQKIDQMFVDDITDSYAFPMINLN